MSKLDQRLFPNTGKPDFSNSDIDRTSLLAIGSPRYWQMQIGGSFNDESVWFANIGELDETLLAIADPEVILSPVVSAAFDCIDVALVLSQFNYSGAYRAVGAPLPDPEIVHREVMAYCPLLDFEILAFDSEEFRELWRLSKPL